MINHKKITLFFMSIIGFIFSVIFPYSFSLFIRRIKERIYTSWVSREFKSFGKGSIMGKNLFLKGGKYIEIGAACHIGRNGVLTAWDRYENDNFSPLIKIGNNSSIGDCCHITAINKIIIGNNVLTGRRVTITDNAHGDSAKRADAYLPPIKRSLFSKGPVIIGDNVWIGDKVSILPNVNIGYGCTIGANAVVVKDVPANCIVVGNPAKIIKM
jgi:acetyltransferase-like isoleucine patch superfamily enzyme